MKTLDPEVRKFLKGLPEKRLHEMAREYDLDPNDYSANGLRDAIAEKMPDMTADGVPEEAPVKPKKAKKKPQPAPEPPKAKKPAQKPPKAKKQPAKKAEPEAPAKPKKKPKAEPVSNGSVHWNGAAFSAQRPGVLHVMQQLLYEASSKKPITKKQIVEHLAKAFPERDAEQMKKTVSMQVPSGLRIEKGLEVSHADTPLGRGYWLDASETAEVGRARVKKAREARAKS
jgi:hypothetical protein